MKRRLQRLARRRVQHRLGRRRARALAHLLDRRPRPRRFDAVANRLIERGDLRRGLPVASDRTRDAMLVLAAAPLRADPAPRTRCALSRWRARRRASRARARSCSSGCPATPGRPCGSAPRPESRSPRFDASSPWRNACPAAQPPATSVSHQQRAESRHPFRQSRSNSHVMSHLQNAVSWVAVCRPHYDPSRIVWRPRPSTYAISIDSAPIRRIR